MKIRKLAYHINYSHILTFKERYRPIIGPYFIRTMQYVVENENSLHEQIKLILPEEGFTIHIRKEGISLIYEKDVADVRKQNVIVDLFFEIYEKIRLIPEFGRTHSHSLHADSVLISTNSEVERQLSDNTILKNPFGKLKEFAAVYEFSKNSKEFNIQLGNFNEKDLKKNAISTRLNADLSKSVGFICRTTIQEPTTSPSFTKFKHLITEVDNINSNVQSLIGIDA